MEYYAHSAEDGTRLQTVAEHLKGTAEKCRAFAAEFGAESIGSLMGNVHDVGKCTEEFQKRLLNDGPKVDHSTAGAVLRIPGTAVGSRVRCGAPRRTAGFWKSAAGSSRRGHIVRQIEKRKRSYS